MGISQARIRGVRVKDLDFDEWHEELTRAWQRKADRLQARRWRKLGREFKGSSYIDYKVNHRGGIL